MAEGWAKKLHGDSINVFSAGIEKHGLNPQAVRVMQEAGVDISTQESKTIEELSHVSFDVVVTVCSHADQTCPPFVGAPHIIHQAFDDPPKLAFGASTEQEMLEPYRRVCEEIRRFVVSLPAVLSAL